jgi:putative PIN family toxin of toxin-antitoxin system
MIKAVFDTNIFISAIIRPQGPPGRLLDMATLGRFELFISAEIIHELEKALTYPRIRDKYGIDEETRELFVDFVIKTCRHVGQVPKLEIVPNDPKDNPVVATALACDADFLVSGDKAHILPLRKIGKLKIVSPEIFKDLIKL